MADPFLSDLTALGGRTRSGLQSLASTRAAIDSNLRPKETPMRLFKQRPVLSALIVAAVMVGLAPVAYAVVDHFVVRIDPDKSEPEIADDVETQLEAAGIAADVEATKLGDGRVKLQIHSDDPEQCSSQIGGVRFDVAGEPGQAAATQMRLQITAKLSPDERAEIVEIMTSDSLHDRLEPTHLSDADKVAAIRAEFAAHGYHAVDATFGAEGVTLTISAPPAP